MNYEYLVFDLDGTISDPKDGIVRSFNYALAAYGFDTRDENELATYIGPPLDSTFGILTGSDDAEFILCLVAKYRERYAQVGFSENVLYEGIPEVLAQLSSTAGVTLGVCTSKRADFAEQILDMFELRHFFSFVSGGDVGIQKWQQLHELKARGVINQHSLMIGDRYIDLSAAHKNELSCAGVLWGYGSLEELEEHAPAYIFCAPGDLLTILS